MRICFCRGLITAVVFLSVVFPACAREVKIVFTGQAYSMLYPCACPSSPEGGVSRRATILKALRAAGPDVVSVEAGSIFGSGPQDSNRQNAEMDRSRTEFYLKALGAMQYDALLVSAQEYAFGKKFLARYEKDLAFVSSNMEGFKRASVLKDLGWIKVGIVGLTDDPAGHGAAGWQPPERVLARSVADLKKRGAGLVILLSRLTPVQDKELLKNVSGIDVVINGFVSYNSVNALDIEGVTYLTTWWEARRAGVLTLDVTEGGVVKKGLEAVSLGRDVADDEGVKGLLPDCFTDRDCPRTLGKVSLCSQPGTKQAQCLYTMPSRVDMTVIRPKACRTCHADEVVTSLHSVFGNLSVREIDEDVREARSAIKKFNLTMLPAYIFDQNVEKSESFAAFNPMLAHEADEYFLKPQFSGVSYILGREKIEKRLDVFFGFDKAASPQFFALLKDFSARHRDIKVKLHLLAVPDTKTKGAFMVREGNIAELEELGRIACVDALYPKKVFDYLICRSKNPASSWWDSCSSESKMDSARIRVCATSEEGTAALLERTKLTQELEVASGPTFVIDNQEIFAMAGVPSLGELEEAVLNLQEKQIQ